MEAVFIAEGTLFCAVGFLAKQAKKFVHGKSYKNSATRSKWNTE